MRSYSKKRERKQTFGNGLPGLRRLTVRQRPGVPTQGLIQAGSSVFACALGRSGIAAIKREGDGATPMARMRLISGYFRRDHVARGSTRLSLTAIRADLGWCEVPGDRNYNRPVRMPYGAAHETMRRDDHLYDVCIVLDWNVRRRVQGNGSAIFFHLARPDHTPTQGCVAVSLRVMQRLLPRLTSRTVVDVVR